MKRIEEIMQQAEITVFPWDDVREQVKFEDGFIEGAKWADKTMIEKACEWMELRLVGTMGSEDAYEFLTKFRKAMEE